MHAKFLDTLDWGILIAYFLILIAIGIWASSKRKKGSSLFFGGTFFEMAPYRILHVGD